MTVRRIIAKIVGSRLRIGSRPIRPLPPPLLPLLLPPIALVLAKRRIVIVAGGSSLVALPSLIYLPQAFIIK